jgi:hypothetical protein
MKYPSIFKNELPHSLTHTLELIATGLVLVLVLFAYESVHAQDSRTDNSTTGQSLDGQYKRGETPTGQKYGIIKEGEPRESEQVKKKSERSNKKQETKSGTGSVIDRDKRNTHEGSGPDPLGRY